MSMWKRLAVVSACSRPTAGRVVASSALMPSSGLRQPSITRQGRHLPAGLECEQEGQQPVRSHRAITLFTYG
ncbi:conserved hypothetical protein [Streptomyces sviceus ATCC 29083]|uniref:Uncharacterized protein n=1 Tax=Streptomyces sviceus (strain ATCC 29083 / DSM 924 / JCM 4929 / NBRC 13980 / NCIMB 11184 / NRRL 5439 / UC 5370) TaxID=463191 RepID=B5I1J0_STRX2|nr:conserved hypothetical protein [Streptomyces sviceus ATCC 29083]